PDNWRRLVGDYCKPLANTDRVQRLFDGLPDDLQCGPTAAKTTLLTALNEITFLDLVSSSAVYRWHGCIGQNGGHCKNTLTNLCVFYGSKMVRASSTIIWVSTSPAQPAL